MSKRECKRPNPTREYRELTKKDSFACPFGCGFRVQDSDVFAQHLASRHAIRQLPNADALNDLFERLGNTDIFKCFDSHRQYVATLKLHRTQYDSVIACHKIGSKCGAFCHLVQSDCNGNGTGV